MHLRDVALVVSTLNAGAALVVALVQLRDRRRHRKRERDRRSG
jgi:hypothetical protein